MKHMFRPALAMVCMALGLLMLVNLGFAAEPTNELGTSDGKTAAALSGTLYCQTKNLVEGQVGVLIGLVLVFIGLWNLISGKGLFSAVLAILAGALIPSMPGLVEGFMIGYRDLMTQSGLSTDKHSLDFSQLRCDGNVLRDDKATLEKANVKPGVSPPPFCDDMGAPC